MNIRKALIAGSLALAGSMAMLASGASAATIPVQSKPDVASPLEINGAVVDLVAYRGGRHWDRRYHGPRYRYRRPGWGHYHGGYWYRTPWWTLPLVAPAIVAPAPVYGGGGSAHVQWCLNRYRSYNPQTDQFLGYDGAYHYCNSPY